MKKKPPQKDLLVELVLGRLGDEVDLWHDQFSEPWASISVDGHWEHWPLTSKRLKRWLARLFFEQEATAPGSQALSDALTVVAGYALFEGDVNVVFTRIAGDDRVIYIDLADNQWRAIQIDASGWMVVENPPVRFRRTAGMLPLPDPQRGGNLDLLWEYMNVDDEDRLLILAWLVQAFRPNGPYPILPVYGEQGSAKTTTARMLRRLIDPNVSPARSEPREEEDLMIAASNGWIVVTDNVSRIPVWLSDAYCRLATGGGLSKRQLYTDADETILDAMRPLILTGIEEFVLRGDLLDRSLIVKLRQIPPDKRKAERAFWSAFDEDCPQILGALMDRVVVAINELDDVRLDRLPRMADFVLWAVAAMSIKEREIFLRTYLRNQEVANEAMLEGSLVATALVEFMSNGRSIWTGTAGELLDKLVPIAGGEDRLRNIRVWPKTPQGMRASLDRVLPGLRRVGIEIDFDLPRSDAAGRRVFEVRRVGARTSETSASDTTDDSDNVPPPSATTPLWRCIRRR